MVDSAYALYLQSPERVATASDAAQTAKWRALARQISLSSGIATEADANACAALILDFYAGPLALVNETIVGVIDIAAIKGRVVTINGSERFVLGGGADEATGITVLECLRKLT